MSSLKNFQYFVHKNYEQIKLFLLFVLVVFGALTLLNLGRAVEDIKDDNAKNHARTQQYVRCIADALSIPLAQRKDIDFDNCSKTKSDAEDNPKQSRVPQSVAPSQDPPAAPRATENVATEPRPPVVQQEQVATAPQAQSEAPLQPPVPQTQRGLLPTALDGTLNVVTGTVSGVRGLLGL
jgi:cytoskeletal protein RodZ